jgi:prepilin-type N-terminal cleavage/methylation domain-containing protein
MITTKNRSPEQGFTIIELMIATAVLSTIILLATVIMTSIGSLYDKGINQARIQDDTRNVTDQLSQDLKFNNAAITIGSGTAVTPSGKSITVYAYCIGTTVRYSYVIGYKIGTSKYDIDNSTPESPDVLWRDDQTNPNVVSHVTSGSSCTPVDVAVTGGVQGSGTELIAPDSRLTAFCIGNITSGACSSDGGTAITSPYDLTVEMAYGDIDLLSGLTAGQQSNNVTCHGGSGDQFCATSILTTTAVQRTTGD